MGSRCEATYTESTEPIYRHNCFIEALPPQLIPEKVASLVSRLPVYDERERALPPLQRLEAVHRIVNCVFPMPEFLELEQKLSRMIRNGYLVRNPLTKEWVRQLSSGFPQLDVIREGHPYHPLMRSTAAGFAIIGASGVGKSTLVEGILGLYPQVIVHTQYHGTPFDQQQLVWLKLDCPFDGSLKGLCIGFFEAIDSIVGTRYATQYGNGRRTIDELLSIMARLAAGLGLGMLVIDEIQRLNEAHSGGAQKMLNFFVQLTNTIGVPIVLVGTFKAFTLFSRDFAMARRSAGQGDVIISNLQLDEYWERFLGKLWKYQWTSVSTPISSRLSKVMYEESQGIVDIAVKIYMLVQWSVIGEESELLTPGRIRDVAKNNFHSAGPILQALRTKDISILSKITDILPQQGELDQFLGKAVKRVTLSGTLDTLRNQEQPNLDDRHELLESPEGQVAALLVGAGHPVSLSQQWARQAVQRFAAEADLKLASSEAFRLAAEHEMHASDLSPSLPQPSEPKKRTKVVFMSGDLREHFKSAQKSKQLVYDELKAPGVIKKANEFLVGIGS
jgi:hypothetical protein